MTYEYDPGAQYRYAIDYRRQHDEALYLELFTEDGWELVGTVVDGYRANNPGGRGFTSRWDGCWYIFRKPWEPGRPDADYEIATDETSLSELQGTLRRKYRRQVIVEALVLVYYLILNLNSLYFPVWIFLALLGLGLLSDVYRYLCVTVLRPRKPLRLFIDHPAARTFLSCLYLVFLIVWAVSANPAKDEPAAVAVTASNTPVQLFLDLEPELSAEDALLLAEEYDLKATPSRSRRGSDPWTLHLYFEPDTGDEYDRSNSLLFYRGVTLALVYDEAGMVLQSAYLSLDTDHGRAYCHYFPGEPGLDNCETGYNLFLRRSALSPQRYYHAESPEEIIAIAYPVLYPEGLS